jgi:sorbitol-specific phosphotransferase system component IIA
MWTAQKRSFKRVFNRLKEAIEINGQPAEGMVFIYGESEEQKLEGYGIIETSHVNLWLLPETSIDVGDEVTLRGRKYRVIEVKDYLGIARKVVLEKAEI